MGFPLCKLGIPLVNKETVLGLHREQRQAGKTKQNAGRKKAESERSHGDTAGDRCSETLLTGHDLMVMHRLVEMG